MLFAHLIEKLVGIELADEWNIIKLVLFIFNESLFASSHLFNCCSHLLIFLMIVKLVDILSMTVDDWPETLVIWVIQGTKLLERKVLINS